MVMALRSRFPTKKISNVDVRQRTFDVRRRTSTYVHVRQRTSTFVDVRRRTSTYVRRTSTDVDVGNLLRRKSTSKRQYVDVRRLTSTYVPPPFSTPPLPRSDSFMHFERYATQRMLSRWKDLCHMANCYSYSLLQCLYLLILLSPE